MLLLFFFGVVLAACGDSVTDSGTDSVTGPDFKDITSPPESSLLWDYRSDVEGEMITVHSVTDGVVYGTSYDQNVYALNSETGMLLWEFRTEGEVNFPLVREGVLYVRDHLHNYYALDAKTGERVDSELPSNSVDLQILHIGGTTIENGTTVDGRIYAMDGYAATAYDGETGKVIWRFEPDYSAVRHYDRPPTIADGVWYLAAGDLHALDINTGKVLWKFKANGAIDPVTVWEDMVFVGSNRTSKLHAIDAATGSSVWGLDGDWKASFSAGSSAVIDGVLYVPSGQIHTFDARSGDYIWSVDNRISLWEPPVVSEGVMYVGYRLNHSGVWAYKVPQR